MFLKPTCLFILIVFGITVLHAEEVPVVRFTVTEFSVEGENPFAPEKTQQILELFLGEHEGLAGLLEAAAELESALLNAGHSFHRVVLPQQTLEQGRIKLKVVVFKLANVDVTGNQYFSAENIKLSLPGLEPGTVPDTRELARELIIANDHPSKQVTLRIKRSKVPDSVDAVLVVQDKRPWQFFTVLNNIGTDETGEFRVTAGFQHSNLLNLDDALTMTYTTSPGHFSDVKQFGFNYRLPLYPLSGSLSFFYSRSDVDSGRIFESPGFGGFDVSGAGKFLGGHYTHTFHNRENYRHRLTVGVDDKLFENNIVNLLFVNLGVDVRTRPLSFQYSGEYRLERANLNFQISYVRNLRGGANNNSRVYAESRAGADQSWEALRYAANLNYALPRQWMAVGRFQGQYTGEPLISGEQFGLGGVNSIRGFEERAVSGDRGNKLNLEIWAPPFKNNIRLLGFVDAGHIKILEAAVGQIKSETLISMGAGFRWQWKQQLNVAFDYAHEVNDARADGVGGSRVHFSVFYSF
ncbi:MAG: ShlB/FhaC/HecB family hemolysin secretion/activation protein [Proteobacteria bacterium]|nr:ShlB/FhaC/HecB family hemolysin secretion/activation protein [Pseudomonadota bacterium]